MSIYEKVSASLRDKLENLQALSSQHTIYRVPDNLKKGKAEYYVPLVVSIGPLYHQLPSVQVMQEYKLRYLKVFLDHGNRFRCLDDYVIMLRKGEERIRMCYEEDINLSSEEFIEMMLLDSSFIIAFFFICAGITDSKETRALKNLSVQVMQEHKLRYLQVFLDHGNRCCLDDYVNMLRNWEERIRICYEENIDLSRDEFMELDSSFIVAFFLTCAGIIYSEEARVLKTKLYQSLPEIKRDLFLAENQVPYFVVEGLCEMAFDKQCPEYASYDIVSAIINAANMIGIYVSYMDPSTTKQKLEASNIEHLLDLLRRTCLPYGRSCES